MSDRSTSSTTSNGSLFSGISTAAHPDATLPPGPEVRVATYNVNYGVAGDTATREAIRALDVDVVFLQETNEAWERDLAGLKSVYPHMAFRHCCNAGGLAVLSKTPFSQEQYVHPEGAWFPAWRVVVQTSVGPVQVVNVHLRPNVSDGGSVAWGLFTTPTIRDAEMEHYVPLIAPDFPTLFVGDFNETADGLAVRRLARLGMKSALPRVGGTQYTWHWKTSVGTIRKQLDHIVHDEKLTLVDAEVRLVGSSDHYPVVATFRASRHDVAGTNTAVRK